jgi:hypothetical protein
MYTVYYQIRAGFYRRVLVTASQSYAETVAEALADCGEVSHIDAR